MRLSPVALVVVAAAALFTADAAKINQNIRKNRGNAEQQQRNLSGKGKGGSKGSTAAVMTGMAALTRAEDDGMNRGQICAAGLARADMKAQLIFPLDNRASSSGKSGKGKVSYYCTSDEPL